MDESQIVEIWTVFKEYVDKKNLDTAAERYVDLLADYGVEDHVLTAALGSDAVLDSAIHYYLEIDGDVEEDYDWE
jgi:hypothetical protein